MMGQGISQVLARSGKRAYLIGRNPDGLNRSMEAIRGNFQAFVDRRHATQAEADAAIARISATTEYSEAPFREAES